MSDTNDNTAEYLHTKLKLKGWDYTQLLTLYYILNSMHYTKRFNKYGRLIKYIKYDNIHRYYAPTRKP